MVADPARLVPSVERAVMVAVPGATAFTKPLASTVATAALLLVQVTFLVVAFSGMMLAVSCTRLPTVRVWACGDTLTLDT